MEFDKFTKEEKIAFWEDVSSEIEKCLELSVDVVPRDLATHVREYLSHNELGIALEMLLDVSIENSLHINCVAKKKLLEILTKMGYQEDEPLKFKSYEGWLLSI